jgi:hypothetical protein
VIAVLACFALAALGDVLTVWWHRARERRSVPVAATLSGALELLTWAPLWLAITTEDWRVVAASVAGSVVGTAIGMRRRAAPE